MQEPYLTKDKLKALIADVSFGKLADRVDTCVLALHTGFRVVGISPGPINAANYSEEYGQELAYDKAFEQLWQLEAYRITAEAFAVKPMLSVTEDLAKLPQGSAVFQVVNTQIDGEPNVDMRAVLIGGDTFDPRNPAHRIVATINNNIDALIAQATGGSVAREEGNEVSERIDGASAALAAPYTEANQVSTGELYQMFGAPKADSDTKD